MVLEKEWKSAVAKGGELGSGEEWRITEGWEERPLCVLM